MIINRQETHRQNVMQVPPSLSAQAQTLYPSTPLPLIPLPRYRYRYPYPLPLASPAAAAQAFCLCLNDVTDQMFLIVRIQIDKFRRNVVIDTVFHLG